VSEREIGQAEAVELLEEGELEVLGRMPWSSNQTYLARLEHRGIEALSIYKPRRGERPLWDFPPGTLCRREVAAFAVSEALGWSIVPLTVLRDGPLGMGMVQLFVDHDPEQHYFTLREQFSGRFRQFALFDVVTNNADRKAGHCLRGNDDHIWGIDHGVSFHAAVKLRTVIWDYEGAPISEDELSALCRLAADLDGNLGRTLARLLNPLEVEAVGQRLQWLLHHGVFPGPVTEYPYPWPMV
jgi:uncharacterized repeat protein (TIGR03843 family)